ncbi:hypothetical protein ABZ915_23640 [Streptomyces sp. NPDC046915]|uniref:hypothetical protein n=1 Tax=Streptomyces sp. NPDC046915 TaxID=3155257 RepID=UPI0033CE8B17
MEAWRAPESLLAPLIVGCSAHRMDLEWIADAFDTACRCLPDVEAHLTQGNFKGKRSAAVLTALMVTSPGGDAACLRRVRWALCAEGEDLAQSGRRWWWEVALMALPHGAVQPAIPADRVPALCEVTRFSLYEGKVRGAQQLALLRHLWTGTLRSRDPELIVLGGQDRWDPGWWPTATAAFSSSSRH